jgi:hypothetical protein
MPSVCAASWNCYARTSVGFFVCLLYGHLAVLLAAAATLASTSADTPVVATTAAALFILTPEWYRYAVSTTDEWAAAVRALVNVGRRPVAASLGLQVSKELGAERTMWSLVSRLPRIPYHERAAALDHFRLPSQDHVGDDTNLSGATRLHSPAGAGLLRGPGRPCATVERWL